MAESRTADEVARQYRDAMGPELGALFHRLWTECAWLHVRWSDYVALFGTSPDRIDILNAAAGSHFRVVQDSLWEIVLLQISRLTDSTNSVGKDNLTLRRLPGLVASDISPEVENLVQEALRRCEFARDWRNRRIAHLDLSLAFGGQGATQLASASRKDVKEALAAIVAVLDAVEFHYQRASTDYSMAVRVGDAKALLYVLQEGLRCADSPMT